MRRALLLIAAVCAAVCAAVLLPGSPAWAHNQLTGSDPAADVTLAAAPPAVTLTFLQRLNPAFTTIVVSDAAKRRVATPAPEVDGNRGTVTLGSVLGNGVYTVAYRVVSVDGHAVQGSFTFTVADPALPPAVAASSAPPPAAAPPVQPRSRTGLLVALGAGVLVVVGGAAYLLRTRRRRT